MKSIKLSNLSRETQAAVKKELLARDSEYSTEGLTQEQKEEIRLLVEKIAKKPIIRRIDLGLNISTTEEDITGSDLDKVNVPLNISLWVDGPGVRRYSTVDGGIRFEMYKKLLNEATPKVLEAMQNGFSNLKLEDGTPIKVKYTLIPQDKWLEKIRRSYY